MKKIAKRKTPQRQLALESLETRLLLDGTGLATLPAAAAWEQVIVLLNDDVNPRAVGQGVVDKHGGQLGHTYEHALKGFSAQLPPAAVAALQRNPNVKLVEPDLVAQTFEQMIPTGVNRVDAELNTVGGIIGVGEGKQVDVNIAIIDTGIDGLHSDLNVIGGQRFYTVTTGPPASRGSRQDSQWQDDNGHGTHVAGIAAAKDNASGVVGVAPGAKLWAVKVLNANGSGNFSDIIAGVDWVTSTRSDGDPNNDIEVANMSLGGQGKSDALRTALQNSVAAGIVYVVAAGNDWRDIHGAGVFNTSDDTIPAAYPEVATISAFADSDGKPGGLGADTTWGEYGQDDAWWGPSNFSNSNDPAFLAANPVVPPGLGIDLVLPGADILSTWLNDGYRTISGTSMAAPHAAGLAALLIAANGRANDAAEVYAIRQALIDGGRPWSSDEGLARPWGPDNYAENLGWAGDMTAVSPPIVMIGEPLNGVVVAGTVTISAMAEAFDGANVTGVEFFVENDSIGEGVHNEQTDVWSLDWKTMDEASPFLPDGSYVLTAVATDSADATASHSITVALDNIDDPPTVTIIGPDADATVSGVVTITAEATDDREVTGVEFIVDGTSITGIHSEGTDVWWVSWNTDTETVNDGPQEITAVATDAGNQTASDVITVNVNNSVANMTSHLAGEAISVNRNFWRANVTATIKSPMGAGLPNAVVTGHWNSSSSPVSATTDQNGRVSFSTGNLSKNVASIDFTVIAVVLAGYEYQGPDTITIRQDGIQSLATNSTVPPVFLPSTEPDALKKLNETRLEAAVDYLMATNDQQDFSMRQPAGRDEPVLASRRPSSAHSDIFDEDLTAFWPEL